MKKTLCIAGIVALLLVVACKKNDGPASEPGMPIPEEGSITLSDAGETGRTVKVTAEDGSEWSFSVADPWLTVEKTDGGLILSTPMYVAEEGTRSTQITLKAGTKETVIEVQQPCIHIGKITQGGVVYWLNPDPAKAEAGAPWPRCRGLVLSLVEAPYLKTYSVGYTNPNTDEGETDEWLDKVSQEVWTKAFPDTFDGKYMTRLFFEHILSKKHLAVPTPYDAPRDNYGQDQGNSIEWFMRFFYPDKTVNGYNDWYLPSLPEMALLNTQPPLSGEVYKRVNDSINAVRDTMDPFCDQEVQPLNWRVKPEDEITEEDFKNGYDVFMSYWVLTQPIRTLTPKWLEIDKNLVKLNLEGWYDWNEKYNGKYKNGKYVYDIEGSLLSIALLGPQYEHMSTIINEGFGTGDRVTYRPIRRF